jgi:ribosomal biogenesis protein LAS1
MMYSMALTRLINGLVAPYQKSLYAVPIGQVAARIGLPPSLVDLRHQASHNQLPSLVQLRSAAKQALQWLEENYWQRQMDMVEQSRTSISDLLSEYKSLQKAFTAKEKNEEGMTTVPQSYNK